MKVIVKLKVTVKLGIMSFLSDLNKQRNKLKQTETVVTSVDGHRFIEKGDNKELIDSNRYGFVVDTKPDDVPIEITDFLYIGSQDCTSNIVLEKYNFKNVLSIGIEVSVTVNNKFVECLDLPETDILPVLKESLPFIYESVFKKENVLIHCNAGVSRTSMVAIGFLMQYKNMTFEAAHALVKEKRPAIQPNAGFKKQFKVLSPGNII